LEIYDDVFERITGFIIGTKKAKFFVKISAFEES
jgi:hypothetical protein